MDGVPNVFTTGFIWPDMSLFRHSHSPMTTDDVFPAKVAPSRCQLLLCRHFSARQLHELLSNALDSTLHPPSLQSPRPCCKQVVVSSSRLLKASRNTRPASDKKINAEDLSLVNLGGLESEPSRYTGETLSCTLYHLDLPWRLAIVALRQIVIESASLSSSPQTFHRRSLVIFATTDRKDTSI